VRLDKVELQLDVHENSFHCFRFVPPHPTRASLPCRYFWSSSFQWCHSFTGFLITRQVAAWDQDQTKCVFHLATPGAAGGETFYWKYLIQAATDPIVNFKQITHVNKQCGGGGCCVFLTRVGFLLLLDFCDQFCRIFPVKYDLWNQMISYRIIALLPSLIFVSISFTKSALA